MSKARYLYSELAMLVQARRNCADKNTPKAEWFDKHSEKIEMLVKQHMPSGSGFDSGTTLDLDASHAEKLVFHTSFHHMNDAGYYDGWTEHTITVTPSLAHRYHLRISGRNRNDIKDYMVQDFDCALMQDVTYDLYREHFPELLVTSKWENEDGTPSQCHQAFYVGDKRFWNSFADARTYAGEEMYRRFMSRNGQVQA